jgi:hypothetical protein
VLDCLSPSPVSRQGILISYVAPCELTIKNVTPIK